MKKLLLLTLLAIPLFIFAQSRIARQRQEGRKNGKKHDLKLTADRVFQQSAGSGWLSHLVTYGQVLHKPGEENFIVVLDNYFRNHRAARQWMELGVWESGQTFLYPFGELETDDSGAYSQKMRGRIAGAAATVYAKVITEGPEACLILGVSPADYRQDHFDEAVMKVSAQVQRKMAEQVVA